MDEDVIRELERLLDDGQVFLAQDLARRSQEALQADPRFLGLYALALVRSGAAEAAQTVLDGLAERGGLDEAGDRETLAALRDLLAGDQEGEGVRARLDRAQIALARLMARRGRTSLTPEATIVLGDCHVELYRRTADEAQLRRAVALFDDAAARGGGARSSAMARLLRLGAGEAPNIAAPTGAQGGAGPHEGFWRKALDACAALEAGDLTAAEARLREARATARATSHRATIMRELLQAAEARGVGAGLSDIFKPPRILVFAGEPFDRPGDPARCPAECEGALREAIRARVADMDPEIGYAAASCGSDLLFVEAMLERGAEVNIVLPFAREDFEAERVGYLDPVWLRRFDLALRNAASVTYATPGPFLGDEALYRFGNQALQGAAIMRGRQFGVDPELLTVWDMTPGGGVGGVSDFIDRWADMMRLHIIDLDEVRGGPAAAPPPAAAAAPGGSREIRALLMSDIVGSSRVTEAQMPRYAAFLNRVAAELAEKAPRPTFANTWGDAVFATSPSAVDLARYALTLKAAVLAHGHLEGALEAPLGMRISLNAGPVLEIEDAIAGRIGNFGAEIVRAARIEPVTTPNHIYATDPFVSLLLAEENEAKTQAETERRAWASSFRIEYIGRVALAKNAGAEGLHHIAAAD